MVTWRDVKFSMLIFDINWNSSINHGFSVTLNEHKLRQFLWFVLALISVLTLIECYSCMSRHRTAVKFILSIARDTQLLSVFCVEGFIGWERIYLLNANSAISYIIYFNGGQKVQSYSDLLLSRLFTWLLSIDV